MLSFFYTFSKQENMEQENMVTESPSAGESIRIFWEGEYHELIIRSRKSIAMDSEILAFLTVKTISTWLHAWKVIKRETWLIESEDAESLASKEYNEKINSIGLEPFVTVFNKNWTGLSITVHSSENGQGAVDSALAIADAKGFIAEKMPQLFNPEKKTFSPPFDSKVVEMYTKNGATEYTVKFIAKHLNLEHSQAVDYLSAMEAHIPKKTVNPPTPTKKDIDDVDSFLNSGKASPNQTGTTQLKTFVRPAIKGTLQGTLKLEKGGKDKLTWETAIIANKPYSHNEVQYQEKDLVVYAISGAIKYDADSSGYFFSIPVESANIRIYQREATNHNGSLIESDSQKLIKHLGLTGELAQGMSWQIPASHIAMKVGKTGEKGQFKNYSGLYALS